MSNFWEKAGVILSGVGLLTAMGSFFMPEIRCFFNLTSEACSLTTQPTSPSTSTQILPSPTPTSTPISQPTSTPTSSFIPTPIPTSISIPTPPPTPTRTPSFIPTPTPTPEVPKREETLPEEESNSGETALVFDPPSNVRKTPNGEILCSVRERKTINIYNSIDSWYYTDICGEMGAIHSSQITLESTPQISSVGVAIVFDPPSNVRKAPNGEILCSVRERKTINIYDSIDSWYYTDVCGEMGAIHSSQIRF